MRMPSVPSGAILAVTCVIACGCSSGSGSTAPSRSSIASTPASAAESVSTTASTGADPVQSYVDAVSALCDALLPKVTALPTGGNLDVPVQQYLAQQPAHAKLLADFDRQLAQVRVPPQARQQADAFAAYVRYANQLDAKRLAAAHQGAAAYTAEIRAEEAAGDDPSVTARNAAGFSTSCDAR